MMSAPEMTKKIWELKEEAKWAPNVEKQMEAIRQLGTFGPAAILPLEEVLSISARNEVRLSCIDAIKGISQNNTTAATANTDEKSNAQISANDGNINNNNNKKNEKGKENVIAIKKEAGEGEPPAEKKSKP